MTRAASQPKKPIAVDPNASRDTPAMRQYARFKQAHPGCVLFFRMGDFYEMFDEDALAVHKTLGLTLTERTPGVPMAGVPHHAVENYIARMLAQGHRVAVCDQIQDPKDAKGVVERAVTRVLTPGALVDEALLADDEANTLCAVWLDAELAHLAIVEVSTGAFEVGACAQGALADELARRAVSEVIYCETATGEAPSVVRDAVERLALPALGRPAWQFRRAESEEALREQFGVATLAGFGLAADDPAIPCAGAVVRYLRETQAPDHERARPGERALAHLKPPKREATGDRLVIDAVSLRALEVEQTIRSGAVQGSLLGVFNQHGGKRTPMGRRLLRDWLRRPLADRPAIEARQAGVRALHDDRTLAGAVQERTEQIQDVARIAGRLAVGRATPRDLVALGASLAQVEGLIEALDQCAPLATVRAQLTDAAERIRPLAREIEATCIDHPPAHLREGGLIRDGVDADLDEARTLRSDASAWLAAYQQRLIEEHDLPNLKVGYNRVFGYFIELPRAQSRRAPDAFSRRQTLKNAERYITPELKEFEDKVTTAESRAIEREQAIFARLCARCAKESAAIGAFAGAVAELDALACFAETARRRGWTAPTITDDPTLEILEGRHPVLDDLLGDRFVPNDLALGCADAPARLALITGPNMAGKSTYIRQAALLTLLAHTGSFIPAAKATIGVADRIFTRVGADDALHAGQSTFMVEMTETATILNNCTARSLVILDEIGRGTSTLDGLALAWAIAERLAGTAEAAGPRTLFATHYHELTGLEETMPACARNLHVQVREWGEEIVFLHRIARGRADRSYGVHVARLAGLPGATVARARDLLESLAVSHEGAPPKPAPAQSRPDPKPRDQLALFTEFVHHPAMDELKAIDLERLTPLEAFDALRRLREMLND